jgi:hypothetical protein
MNENTTPIRFSSRLSTSSLARIDPGKIINALRSYRSGLLLWGLFVLFLALVQFSTPDLPDNDGYYHIKLAYLMRTEGLKPEFSWLPLSILNPREFYDHHFLFHTALIPFTFGDLRVGAKWAAIFFASLAFLSTWNLLKNQRVAYSALWAAGLIAISEAFIFRMSITRAQSLSLAVLMLGLDWLLHKKYLRLGLLAFTYVWLYDAFPLLLVFAGAVFLAEGLIERRLDFRLLLYTTVGTGLGLLINPYFPHNIVFAYLHILPKLVNSTAVNVGNEWFPYTTTQLLKNSPLALVSFVSATLGIGLSGRRIDTRSAASFLLASFFALMLFQSRRFIEYFAPFSLVMAAFAWAPVINTYITSAETAQNFKRLRRWLPAAVLMLALLPGTLSTFFAAKTSVQAAKPYQTYAGASNWLIKNTPQGARVFQTDWDDFPRLFYYNTHNRYLIGLDPTYMLIYDAELYNLWVEITQGKVAQPSTAIVRDFGASYIITDLRHQDFLNQAAEDTHLVETYRDSDAVVFRVISD